MRVSNGDYVVLHHMGTEHEHLNGKLGKVLSVRDVCGEMRARLYLLREKKGLDARLQQLLPVPHIDAVDAMTDAISANAFHDDDDVLLSEIPEKWHMLLGVEPMECRIIRKCNSDTYLVSFLEESIALKYAFVDAKLLSHFVWMSE